MPFTRSASLALLPILGACQQPQQPSEPVEYRPEEAGTVDHALCLLGFTAIPVQELSSGHFTLDVSLDGRPATFILDTGANVTVLDARYADQYGLTEADGLPGFAIGTGNGKMAQQIPIDSLRIGPVEIRQDRIALADLGGLPGALGKITGSTIHGIVGQDVLSEHRAVIDVARSILYLIEEDEEPAPVPATECVGAERGPEAEAGS